MKDLIPNLSELIDDLRQLRELDDGSVNTEKLDKHIETIEFILSELSK